MTDKFRECVVKVGFFSKKEAYAAVRRMQVRLGSVRLHYYKCKYCKFYHVGHWPRDRRIS